MHTVVVGGTVVKRDGRLVGIDLAAARNGVDATVSYLRETLGEEAWLRGQNPDLPQAELFDNPYQYTDYGSGTSE
ncbi:hypothetical protein [Actinoplanes philippinensis]|uniref:hypothetical protein n=1 Tax=Actinoplanes philippinensis TaxID=35752 RepID=UPI0033EB6C4C